MGELGTFQEVLWALLLLVHVVALAAILFHRSWRTYPAFAVYISLNLAQGAVLFALYRTHGFTSQFSRQFAWGTQAAILCARGTVIGEICRHLLSRYRGIWALAWRILSLAAVLLALYALAVARWKVRDAVLAADLGLELTIAIVLTMLFLFARYYGIAPDPTLRTLAIGLFLFSCFTVLNNAGLTHSLVRFELWNIVSGLAFLASLLLWTWAFRTTVPVRKTPQVLLPDDVYSSFAPEVNSRLRRLNDSLSHFFEREAHNA